jgi:hypothetical protein
LVGSIANLTPNRNRELMACINDIVGKSRDRAYVEQISKHFKVGCWVESSEGVNRRNLTANHVEETVDSSRDKTYME